MKRPGGIIELWRGGADRALSPRVRAFGSARTTMRQRIWAILSPESFLRLILAFVLATALWLFVTSRPEGSFAYPQPINIQEVGVGSGLTVGNVLPKLHFSIASGIDAVNAIAQPTSNFEAHVDLSHLGPGVHPHVRVVVTPLNPVTIVSQNPRYVAVDVERVITKTVPITLDVLAAPPFGYEIGSGGVTTQPTAVRVTGAASLVGPVSEAVVSISLANAHSDFDREFAPVPESKQGKQLSTGLFLSPALVRVHVDLLQVATYRTIPVIPSVVGFPGPGFALASVTVLPETVTAYGPEAALSQIQNLRTSPVDVTGLTAGQTTVTVHVLTPTGVSIKTSTAHVRLKVISVSEETLSRVKVEVRGPRRSHASRLDPSVVTINVRAKPSRLITAAAKVQAFVNAQGVGPGSHQLRVYAKAPAGVHILSIQPEFVIITTQG